MHKIGIISDTHGMLRDEVKEILSSCDAILHGGDINRKSILDELHKLAPVYVVRGNNDKEWAREIPETLHFELFGVRFYMIHNQKKISEPVDDRDIVVYGHSHKYAERRENGILWLNPGSCGPRRFQSPVTMAVMELEDNGSWQVKKIELLAASKKKEQLPDSEMDTKALVQAVMKETDRHKTTSEIAAKYGISRELAEQICRLYVTHPGIDADGILNKMQ